MQGNPDESQMDNLQVEQQNNFNESQANGRQANMTYQEILADSQADMNEKKPAAVSFEKAYATKASEYTNDEQKQQFVTARDASKHQNGYPHKDTIEVVKKRNFEWERVRLEKIAAQRDLDKDKDLEGCTFAPELVTKKNGQKPRSKKTFLKTQQEFLNNKNQKQEDLKRELSKTYESVTAPTLSTQSKKIVERKMAERKNIPTYERLYNLNQEQKVKKQQKVVDQEVKVQQESRMTTTHGDPERRGAPVHIALNSLAQNKQTRIEQMRRQIEQSEQEKIRSGEFKNAQSQEIAGNRIKRELNDQLKKIELTEESKLSFKLTETILTQLGFLPSAMPKGTDSIDYKLFEDLWALMQGEQQEGVSKDTLEYLLLCIMGNFNLELEVEPEAQDEDEQVPQPTTLNEYGSYTEEGVFVLRRKGQKKVFNHFNILFANRLTFYQNKPVEDLEAKKMTDMPLISQKTQKLAQQQRAKKLGDAADTGDFVSYIYAKDQKLSEQNKMKADEINRAREENNSHRPQIIDYEFTNERSTTGDTNLDLYSKVKRGAIAEKADRRTDEIEIEKFSEEFTMRPKINNESSHLSEDVDMTQIKGFEHKMTQLNMGRELKEKHKQATERGIPVSNKRPPTVVQEDIKYVRTKTNKYQSDFGEVTVSVRKSKLNSTLTSTYTRPKSFFDPYGSMKRSVAAQDQNQDSFVAEENAQQNNNEPENQVEQQHDQEQEVEDQQQNDVQDQQEADADQIDNQRQEQQQNEQLNGEAQEQVADHEDAQQQQVQENIDQERTEQQNDDSEQVEESDQKEINLNVESSDQKNAQDDKDSSVQLQGEAQQISPVKTDSADNNHENGEQHEERDPKLYVDVNVANYGLQRIVVYEGDTVESLVADFIKRCPIDEFMIEKLKLLLQQQIDGVLERIDEDQEANDEDEEDTHDQNNGANDSPDQHNSQKPIDL